MQRLPRDEQEDREANYFAMCLLMPEKFVHAECDKLVKQKLWDESGIRILARTFGVSEFMMTIRLTQLKRINLASELLD